MKLPLSLILAAIAAHAQYVEILGSDYPANSLVQLNLKPALRAGAGAPTGNCTAGRDLYIDTTGLDIYFCGTLNVWTRAGKMLSAFGRTGAVVATTGDYTAAQVTNAVDSTQAYPNPSWITSLAWAKITGAPSFQLLSEKGAANGYASLDASAQIPNSQMCAGTPSSGQYCDPITRLWTNIPSGSGESTTGSNLGSTSPSVFSSMVGFDLRFRRLRATHNLLTIVENGDYVDFTINPGNFSLSSIGGSLGLSQIGGGTSGQFIRHNGTNWLAAALVAGDIPVLDTAKITSGIFDVARIPDLAASKITSGVFPIARLATGTPDGTKFVADDGTLKTPPSRHTIIDAGGANMTARAGFQLLNGDYITWAFGDNAGLDKTTATPVLDLIGLNAIFSRLNATNTAGTSGKWDLRAASTTDGFGMPTASTASPTSSGYCGFGTNDLLLNCGRNGSTESLAWRDVGLSPLLISRNNAGTTGTTVNLLAKLNASGQAIVTATSDTNGAVGVVVSGAGTSGTAKIAHTGIVDCVADNATTIGHYVILGSSTAGRCRDGGSTYPTSGQVVGRFLTAVSGGASASVLLFGLGQQGGSTGGSGDVVGPGSAASGNVATFNGTTGKLIQDGGKALPSGAIVGTSDTQTLTAKTLTTPIITSYTVAGLPAATTAGQLAVVTDGRFKGDCTVGGGSSLTECRASGSAWVPINGPIYQSVSTIFGSSLAASSGDLWAGVSNTATGTSQASRQWMMGPAHTVTKLCVRTTSAQPSLGSLVITVQAGDTFNGLTDTATVLTIAASAAAGLHCTTTQSDIAADQWMVLKVRNNDSGSVSAVMERPVITVAYK